MQIEQLHVKNYGVLRNAKLVLPSPLTIIVGANGTGKSTLFDVFSFLKAALADNVASAVARRGGFQQLVSRGEDGPISITVKFRESGGSLATYILEVAHEQSRVVVTNEVLRYRKGNGRPWNFLNFSRGRGAAIMNEPHYGQARVREERRDYELDDPSTLAVKGLGQFRAFPVVTEFRRLIELSRICDSPIDGVRLDAKARCAEPYFPTGFNLARATRHLHEHHPEQFDLVLEAMQAWVPGLDNVGTHTSEDQRLQLRFEDGSFRDPFAESCVSDGTIELLTHLVKLHDPNPHPLLAITAPESHLYPSLLGELIEAFRAYAGRRGQAIISTYSPEFLQGADIKEVAWLVKTNGFSKLRRASDSNLLRNLADKGDSPGALWTRGLFDGADPKRRRLPHVSHS